MNIMHSKTEKFIMQLPHAENDVTQLHPNIS